MCESGEGGGIPPVLEPGSPRSNPRGNVDMMGSIRELESELGERVEAGGVSRLAREAINEQRESEGGRCRWCDQSIEFGGWCSRACLRAERRGTEVRGGYGSSWSERRMEAIEQAGECCERCGMGMGRHQEQHGTELHVHHKIPFKVFGRKHHEIANSPWNLMVVCTTCHQAVEPAAQRRASVNGVVV